MESVSYSESIGEDVPSPVVPAIPSKAVSEWCFHFSLPTILPTPFTGRPRIRIPPHQETFPAPKIRNFMASTVSNGVDENPSQEGFCSLGHTNGYMGLEQLSDRLIRFAGGHTGVWRVLAIHSVQGDALPQVERVAVYRGNEPCRALSVTSDMLNGRSRRN